MNTLYNHRQGVLKNFQNKGIFTVYFHFVLTSLTNIPRSPNLYGNT